MRAAIWDLDGTLIDSYTVITESVAAALASRGIASEEGELRRRILSSSVRDVLAEETEGRGLDFEELYAEFTKLSDMREGEIEPIRGARETLELLGGLGARCFVYTHKGASAERILRRLGMWELFTEVVTSRSGFRRKPCPDGIEYLLSKYSLSKGETFYIGDRALDMEAAKNAGVRGVMYRPEGSLTEVSPLAEFVVGELCETVRVVMSQ